LRVRHNMKVVGHITFRHFLPVILLSLAVGASAQTTIISNGNWDQTGIWTAGNIGDAITEDVTVNTSVIVAIPTGLTYTIGDITATQDNTLTLEASSVLNVGASGNAKDFVIGNNGTITVNAGATLEIWGTLNALGNITINNSGTIHIHGSTQFSNVNTNVQISGSGSLYIDGAMGGGNNVNFNVNGYVEVFGSLAVGSGSNLTGAGIFKLHGSCSGTPFCSSGILPVELLFFRAKNTTSEVNIAWATASELDVDYFTIEKSSDGKRFDEIGKISGTGNSSDERIYTYVDEKPMAGSTFYRLNEITRNGEKTVLSTLRNKFDASKSVDVYPNPAVRDEPLSFALNFKSTEAHEISIFDVRGVLMGKGVMNGSEATLPLQLGVGVYIVRVASSDFVSVQRIVVQ
jgi:hypothetical protein